MMKGKSLKKCRCIGEYQAGGKVTPQWKICNRVRILKWQLTDTKTKAHNGSCGLQVGMLGVGG